MKNMLDELNVTEQESCKQPIVEACDPVTIDSCSTCENINLGNVEPTNPGLLIDVSATLRNLCPNRQISVACVLCERVGQRDVVRGVQVRQLTTPETGTCVSLNVDFQFAFSQKCCGNNRKFKAKIIAHYLNPDCECPCPKESCEEPCHCQKESCEEVCHCTTEPDDEVHFYEMTDDPDC